MIVPLEDDCCDILKKARTGLGLSAGDVSRRAGLSDGVIAALERGEQARDRAELLALANALGLRSEPLAQIAIDKWEPVAQRQPDWIETVHGSIGGYGVQGYIVHDEGEALLIDTAYNASVMIEVLNKRDLRLVGICLTHGHADHAEGIDRILTYREVPVELETTGGAAGCACGRLRHQGRPPEGSLPHDSRPYTRRNLLSDR